MNEINLKKFPKDKKSKQFTQSSTNQRDLKFDSSDIGCIASYDSDFIAVKKKAFSLPSVATFTNVRYTPSNYPVNGVTNLLDAEIGVYVNKCLGEGKKINVAEFISRFNDRYCEAVKLVSIESIDLYRRKIKEQDEETLKDTNVRDDTYPSDGQKQEVDLQL